MEEKNKKTAAGDEAENEIASLPIEKCFEELETIVAAMESETTSLEESLKLFERGIKLSKRCSSELKVIERKIQLIVENTEGGVQFKEFEPEDEPEE